MCVGMCIHMCSMPIISPTYSAPIMTTIYGAPIIGPSAPIVAPIYGARRTAPIHNAPIIAPVSTAARRTDAPCTAGPRGRAGRPQTLGTCV